MMLRKKYFAFHPEAPKATKTPKSLKAPEEFEADAQAQKNRDWQIQWNGELEEQLIKKESEIIRLNEQLERQNHQIPKLMRKIERRDQQIERMQRTCDEIQILEQNIVKADEQTKTIHEHQQISSAGSLGVSKEYVRNIHSYARIDGPYPNRKISHKCARCGFVTGKKSTWTDHQDFCTPNPSKEIKCPICHKLFTYRRLMNHFNHFASGKHKAGDSHRNYTPIQHKMIIETIKFSYRLTK